LEPAELWAALHVRRLASAALHAAAAVGELPPLSGPLVVIDGDDRMQRVLQADPLARQRGVQRGMSLAAALALAPEIDARPRDLSREQSLLAQLASLGQHFTPRVSIEPPDGLLLEIKGSRQLFGGLDVLCEQILARYQATGVTAALAVAPTPLAALVGARCGAPLRATDPQVLGSALAPLPLAALRWPTEAVQRLAGMGVRTIGAALRLPRAGFARRFGPVLLQALDRLLGHRHETRGTFATRERFYGRFEPSYEITAHAALLAVLTPLLDDLEHFLLQRQRGITRLQCRFRHRQAPATVCTLGLAAPEANAARLAKLLAEKLAPLALPAPVILCELRSGPLVARPLASAALWSPGEHGHAPAGEMPALVEHLRARLGAEAVYGLCRVPEHRPEAAWRVAEPSIATSRRALERPTQGGRTLARRAMAAGGVSAGSVSPPDAPWSPFRRPLWLLAQPRELTTDAMQWPQHAGAPLRALHGPERIETGWWDGAAAARDYYSALDASGVRLWVFRERTAPHRWCLHGVFG
jgi:protein ImuB